MGATRQTIGASLEKVRNHVFGICVETHHLFQRPRLRGKVSLAGANAFPARMSGETRKPPFRLTGHRLGVKKLDLCRHDQLITWSSS
ncbi:MAG: hypothetical protein AAFN16_23085, partial [Pseudomonadota bacterium]